MKINERLFLLSIAIPLYLLLLWSISKPFLGKLSLSNIDEKSLLSAISYDSRNATYHYLLGRFYHYSSEAPDLNKAIEHYRESIRLSPLQVGCWLDLSKAYQIAGLIEAADNTIERAIRLDPENPSLMWEAGTFYLINGNTDIAVKALRRFILLRPERQEYVYDMLYKLPLDSQYILTNLIPDSYPYYRRYLLYLISADRAEESKSLWKRMEGVRVDDELFIRYTDFLISKHLYKEAENIWKDFIDKRFEAKKEDQSSLLYNSSFESDILNGGFDWRIGKAEGVRIFLDRDIHILGGRSLGVTFDGKQNPDITMASHVVRVTPKTGYKLRGYIKTDSITTTNGLFFSVTGHDCKGFYKKSDVITGTNLWREIEMEFETPPECTAISINIRREKSYKLDNKIGGTAWIDGISLARR
jgi:tetratricopeptide (TPR) repeat protein